MKYKILAGLLGLVISFLLFVNYQSAYPSNWNQVKTGMTRQQVYELAGLPTEDSGEIKGAFWFQAKMLTIHELHVYFEGDTAKYVDVTRYVGTSQEFAYKKTIQSN
jgi:outer membrane protein assembly factor BamE (lipoprotein component of BamABCDE complex)